MSEKLRYICVDCKVELRRCNVCNSVVHGVVMVNGITREHSHGECPALLATSPNTLREVDVA